MLPINNLFRDVVFYIHVYGCLFPRIYFSISESIEGGHSLSHPVNCTVAFMSKCMSSNKCKLSCKSMGAAKYRWTHNEGCCQCIGSRCIDYGLNEPMCLQCHGEEDDEMLKIEPDVVLDEAAIDTGLN